jgi:hypothetical protein
MIPNLPSLPIPNIVGRRAASKSDEGELRNKTFAQLLS